MAVLADSATQLLVQALRGTAYEHQIDLVIFEADYDQIDRQILDGSSELYRFAPEFVLVFKSVEKLLARFREQSAAERSNFAATELESTTRQVETLAKRCSARVIHMNYAEVDDGVFGNFAGKVRSSWMSQLRRLNVGLMDLAESSPRLFLCDLALLQSQRGQEWMSDRRIALTTQLLFSLDALPLIAQRVIDVVLAASGRFKKCLIMDLDNTLWGGVIGDDGVENIELGELGIGAAYVQLQSWAKELKGRGIILAVCTKNDPKIAAQPFESHPDMVLHMQDIALFVATWDNKVDSIRHIQSVIEIGFDSMVFVDDNPAEREIVRRNIPQICVPELPDDPAEHLDFLVRSNLFETALLSADDAERTKQYQTEGRRRELKANFATEEEFLRSLDMVATVSRFTAFNTPRVAQLTQRSNQFNLRTVRYDETQIRDIEFSADHLPFAFTLKDSLGDHGLISVVILKRQGNAFFVDTWLMSCRVLRRGMEAFVLNTIAQRARGAGAIRLIGEFRETVKNGLVREHYASLGFERQEDLWYLDLAGYTPRPTFIRQQEGD
jgi:FkbH-like protein